MVVDLAAEAVGGLSSSWYFLFAVAGSALSAAEIIVVAVAVAATATAVAVVVALMAAASVVVAVTITTQLAVVDANREQEIIVKPLSVSALT